MAPGLSVDTLVGKVVSATVAQLQSQQGFSFSAPRYTLAGEGSSVRLGKVLMDMGYTSIFIVTDVTVCQLGLHHGLLRACEQLGMPARVFDQVDGEPDAVTVEAALAEYRQQPAAMVVGVGGGSALDAAKAMAVLVDDPVATIESMSAGAVPWRRSVGLACIPTTAGTGSEVTDVIVIMGRDQHIKHLLKGVALIPDIAVLDGNLMLGLPPGVTAATGIDALTHAIEAFVCREMNPLSRALAYGAVKDISFSLPRAVGNGADGPARCDMSLAAYNAGLAFGNSGLGLVHAMSHAIGAYYNIPHGLANALLLTEVMRFNRLVCEADYAELAIALGVATERLTQRERSLAAIEAVESLLQDIGLYRSLREFRAQSEDFPMLAEQVLEDPCCASNPRQVCIEDITRIYQAVLER